MTRISRKLSKPIIGLTGGIGSGKTTVSAIFQSLGSVVIDADVLAHDQLNNPDVVATLISWWGESICNPDGSLNRHAIGEVVFNEPAELSRLEGLLYPRIHQQRDLLMDQYEVDPAICAIVLDTPKLFEAGVNKICNSVVFVDADRPERMRRAMAQRGWTLEEYTKRENLQDPLDKKKKLADYIVVNHSDTADIRCQVERILASVITRFNNKK